MATAKTKEIRKLNKEGIDFLCGEEGLRLKPYLDKGGTPTIGYGNTYYEDGTRVTMKDKAITKTRAQGLFCAVIAHYEIAVWSATVDTINQHQFNALCSFVYNIGVEHFKKSTVLRLLNKNINDPAIAAAFELFKYCDGEPILLARRKRESALYFSLNLSST